MATGTSAIRVSLLPFVYMVELLRFCKVGWRNHQSIQWQVSTSDAADEILVIFPIKCPEFDNFAKILCGRLLECLENEFRAVNLGIIKFVLDVIRTSQICARMLDDVRNLGLVSVIQSENVILHVFSAQDPISKWDLLNRTNGLKNHPGITLLGNDPAV